MSTHSSTPSPAKIQINPPVFFSSIAFTLAFVILGVAAPDYASQLFSLTQARIIDNFGWFYLLSVAVFLIFCLTLALSSYGSIKLGPDHSQPDFSYRSWFAMLFSAGMGIGLLFFGVAEPITHMSNPPQGDGHSIEAARQAMSTTFFHWGLHAWAIYAVVGLALAYFGFRHGLPLTIRSALYPLLGEKIYGPIGHTVDTFAVLGTMFGIATSLGLGVMQINTGLNHLFDIPVSVGIQVALIAAITVAATVSVVLGLDGGIRRLSELNLLLAFSLLVFMLFAGPTQHLLQAVVQNTGTYLNQIVDKTFHLYAYEPTEWMSGWTLFYWGWWIAWSPFVGMFIARVSRGRTIREFVFGVLFVPAGFTFMWMTFFGNTAISLDFGVAQGAISAAVGEDVSIAIFKLFEYLPFGTLASLVATVLVITFFITSSDSGSMVIDMITSGGNHEPPVWQRVFWAVTEGVVAAVLLFAGGLVALQSAAIASALPFTFVMLVICYGLFVGLRRESLKLKAQETTPALYDRTPWEARLRRMMSFPNQQRVIAFINSEALDAFNAVKRELEQHERLVSVEREDNAIHLRVHHNGDADFTYAVIVSGHIAPSFVISDLKMDEAKQNRYYRADVHLAQGSQGCDIMGYTREQIIGDILSQYDRHLQYLHMAHGSELPTSDPAS